MYKYFLFLLSLHVIYSQTQSKCEYPNLSQGHLNLTSESHFKQLKQQKEDFFLLSISAPWCQHCCGLEPHLKALTDENVIKVVRADMEKQAWVSKLLKDIDYLPIVFVVWKGEMILYNGDLEIEEFKEYIRRLKQPIREVKNIKDLLTFMEAGRDNETTKIVGVFEDRDDDDSEYFTQIARKLVSIRTFEFVETYNKAVYTYMLKERMIKERNAIFLQKPHSKFSSSLGLDYSDESMKDWILTNSIQPMDELESQGFLIAKELQRPILMFFLDPKAQRTAGLIDDMKKLGKKYQNHVIFLWLDGNAESYVVKRKQLGILHDELPSVAFNMLDSRILPFPQEKKIDTFNINEFVQDFIRGKIVPQQQDPTQGTNKVEPEDEKLYRNCDSVTIRDFDDKVYEEGYDVVVYFYQSTVNQAKEGEETGQNINRVCQRFKDLDFPNFRFFRMDVTKEPSPKNFHFTRLPSFFLVPAFHKKAPFRQYSGTGRPVEIMYWIAQFADRKMELPSIPHMHEAEKQYYYEQKMYMNPEDRKRAVESNERKIEF